jgi:4-amino-4-deoxy-L-arabinose transferase-like glycosyltransferase
MPRAVALLSERLRGEAAIVALACVGFFLTLAYGAYLAPEWDPGRDDQKEYLALARGIVERSEYTRAVGLEAFFPESKRLPGYPFFIAPLCIRGCTMWGITFVQAILVAILIVVVAKFAEALLGRRGGLIAGGLVALNPSFAFFGAHALSDLLGTVMMVGSIAASATLIPSRRAGGFLAGILAAASALTRPLLIVTVPVTMLLVGIRHGLRRVALPFGLLLITLAVGVSPYVVYVESAFGRPLPASNGTQLWLGYFEAIGPLDATEREQAEAGRAAVARFTALTDRAEQARAWIVLDDELGTRARALIAHDPWGFAARGVFRSAVLWTGDVPLRAEDITAMTATLWRIGGLTWFLVGFLGAMFMIRRGVPLTALPLLVILATWAVSYPLWAEGRYSLPAQPFVAIGIAAMLIRLRNPTPRAVSSRARIVQVAPK